MTTLLILLGLLCLLAVPVLLVMYIVFWIKKRNKDRIAKAIPICFIMAIVLIIVGGLIGGNVEIKDASLETTGFETSYTNPSETTGNDVVESTNKTTTNTESPESAMLKTLTDSGYTLEHAKAIEEILNTLGINNISVYGKTGSDNPENGVCAFVCYPNGSKDKDKRFNFTTEDGVMFFAGFRSITLYDSEQGGVLKTYTDALKES